jgi:hypothetical protein
MNKDSDDDNSDEDIGRATKETFSYDSDDKLDEEAGKNELIDLGSSTRGASKSSSNIKALKGPGGR